MRSSSRQGCWNPEIMDGYLGLPPFVLDADNPYRQDE